jgi:hypothetical protein
MNMLEICAPEPKPITKNHKMFVKRQHKNVILNCIDVPTTVFNKTCLKKVA